MHFLRRLPIILLRFPAAAHHLPAQSYASKHKEMQKRMMEGGLYAKHPYMVATVNPDGKQVHEERLRYISDGAHININSEIPIKVRISDPLEYPSGNALIAELHGDAVKNCTAGMTVQVSDDELQVEVELKKKAEQTNFHCELEIPLRASASIRAEDTVRVDKLYGEKVCVEAVGTINASDLNAKVIRLISEKGCVRFKGRLLGQDTLVETKGTKGNIFLDKLLGAKLVVRTLDGNIRTDSCYSDHSTFETKSGKLALKNVHNEVIVRVQEQGAVQMTGVNGNLNVHSNGGTLNLQISKLDGASTIVGRNMNEAVLNLSQAVEDEVQLSVSAAGDATIVLSDDLAHLKEGLNAAGNKLEWRRNGGGAAAGDAPTLKVDISGCAVRLGKSSWSDSVRAAMDEATTASNSAAKK